MPLSDQAAAARGRELLDQLISERRELDSLRRYWLGWQQLPAVIPDSAPREVREMARMARVNVVDIVVESLTQSLNVDGYRAQRPDDGGEDLGANVEVWRAWQANRWDRRQSGVHAAAVGYGTGWAVGLPGDPLPVMRGVSPRLMTAAYGDDPDWPVDALEKRHDGTYRLYDDEAVYRLAGGDQGGITHLETLEHGVRLPGRGRVTPVIRYLDSENLDGDDEVEPDDRHGVFDHDRFPRVPTGQIARLVKLQDQVDLITFNLLVAQHYSAFRQRLLIGWLADDEAKKASSASQLWTIDKNPEEVSVHEFAETNLSGYIDSRKESLRHTAALSQTPTHELIGDLVNLTAEALAAAEAGRDRKVEQRKTSLGESHEQILAVVGSLMGVRIPDDAQVVWRDTSARAFGAIVDALGKLTQMLGVPPQELWDRIPGVTQQDVRRWRAVAAEGDSLDRLTAMLDRQASNGPAVGANGEQQTDSGLIVPAGPA